MNIARLRGAVDDVGLEGVLIDVGGIGFPVLVSTRTRAALPPKAEPATLLIETQIREDAVLYFGFIDRTERDWFRLLTTVQGVGGKVALNVLSVLDPERLAEAIAAQDKASLGRADGVGPKLAARLITELKEKAASWRAGLGPAVSETRAPIAVGGRHRADDPHSDALAALIGLQFKAGEAQVALDSAARRLGANATADALIRAALQEFAR